MKIFLQQFLLLLLCAVSVSAQIPSLGGNQQNQIHDGKINGKVTDSKTAKAVSYANVALNRPGKTDPIDGTITDEKGNFQLKNIKPGFYKISVTFIGYTTFSQDSIEITER